MRVATVLAIASAYGAFVDALGEQGDHPMLRDLGAMDDENQSQLVPQLMFLADSATPGSCYWSSSPVTCTLSNLVNNVKLGDTATCAIPVPVPTDNYVGDKRKNKNDDNLKKIASDKPYVEVTSSFGGSTTTTGKTAWYEYVTNPTTVQQQLTFNAPGLYDMSIIATDYDRTASCDQCVSVTDEFRPRFSTGTCPSAPTSPATLTTTTLTSFNNYEKAFLSYVDNTNVENNGNSAARCDDTSSQLEAFYGILNALTFASECYDTSQQATNIGNLKSTPLTATDLQSESSSLETTLNGECTWRCTKSKTVKENYVAYACPSSSPAATCAGGPGNACLMDVTLQATGNDIATRTIGIHSGVQTASTNVIAALPTPPTGANAAANVYYAIPCTDFSTTDTTCHYVVKLSELLDVTPTFQPAFPVPSAEATKVKEYVFWRYNFDGEAWNTWDPDNDVDVTFKDAATTVTVEAWTACGQVGATFTFDVKLYVHSALTCDLFDDMWTLVGSEEIGGANCAYSGSDFAIINLDMDITDIIPHGTDTVTGNYASVNCDILVEENGAGTDPSTETLVDATTTTVTKDFAVEMVHDPTTAQKTAVKVSCTFTRTAHINEIMLADTDPHTITCDHSFTITDCDDPELYHGDQADVCADTCAGNALPGVNEACDGTVVTSTATATSISTTSQACCADCSPELQCVAVASTDVKRCEIPEMLLLAQLAAVEQSGFAGGTTMALLGASAMVAVVALVVVKRRAETGARAKMDEDAYYPLLE